MPGTRNVAQLEADKPPNYAYGPLVGEIRRALADAPTDKKPRACFAVKGTGLEALRAAHSVLVKNAAPRRTFPMGSDLSLVFFSHQAGSYVHLQEAETKGNRIRIRYRIVPHETREMTSHFAIVPLGRLDPGRIAVKIMPSRIKQDPIQRGLESPSVDWKERVVCKSFAFVVASDGERWVGQ